MFFNNVVHRCVLFMINELLHYNSVRMDSNTLHFIYFLAVVGGIWFIFAISKFIWMLVRLLFPRKDLVEEYGENAWAVVTGASDGIGLAFAKELARENFNICLMARNIKKLQAVEVDIRELYPSVKTQIVIADFANSQEEQFFERIHSEIQKLDIGILVNNAGISNISEFQELSLEKIKEEINVNCLPTACLTSLLIPKMLLRDSRSAIVNVSSTAAVFACPYTANYSGTKAYGTMLSKGIQLQLEDRIDVLCVQPMVVETNLSRQSNRWDVITPEECAKASLNSLGYDTETRGHWKHRFIRWAASKLPDIILNYSAKKALKKLVQEQKSTQ